MISHVAKATTKPNIPPGPLAFHFLCVGRRLWRIVQPVVTPPLPHSAQSTQWGFLTGVTVVWDPPLCRHLWVSPGKSSVHCSILITQFLRTTDTFEHLFLKFFFLGGSILLYSLIVLEFTAIFLPQPNWPLLYLFSNILLLWLAPKFGVSQDSVLGRHSFSCLFPQWAHLVSWL